MRRISGKLTASAMLLTLALGCNPEQSVRPRSSAFEATTTPAPTLVLHVVAPRATDPAIDQGLDDHYVWLDTTARSNHKLFVFLPGTGQNPSIFQLVQQEAARLGYHVIGLMYPTGGGLAKACPTTTDPSACYENARLEIIDGIDRVAFLNVSVANSIDNRLTKLLQYLALQYPDEGWDRFLLRDGQHSDRSPVLGRDARDAGGALLRHRARSRRVLSPDPGGVGLPRARRLRRSRDARDQQPSVRWDAHARHRSAAAAERREG